MDFGFEPPKHGESPRSLGILDLYSARTEQHIKRIPLSVHGEIKAPWEKPFKAFPTLYHALAAATLSRKACVIALVGTHAGLFDKRDRLAWFRVFETDHDKYSFDRSKFILSRGGRENPLNTLEVRYVNFYSRTHSASWDELKKQYAAQRKPSFAKSIIRDKLDLAENEVSIYGGEIRTLHIYGKDEDIKKLDTDTLSFDHFSEGVRSHGNGVTYTLHLPEASRRIESTKIPKAYAVLNASGLLKPTPAFFISTIAHEAMHEVDAYRLRFQINRWRESSARLRRPPQFLAWLVGKVEKKRDGFVERDLLVARNYVWDITKSRATARAVQNATQRYGLLSAQSSELHHLEPHLHGLALKLWLDKSRVKGEFRKHNNSAKSAAGFIYFSDIGSMDGYFFGRSGYKGADRVAERAAHRIVDIVTTLDSAWVPMLKQYVQDSIDGARRQKKGQLLAMVEASLP